VIQYLATTTDQGAALCHFSPNLGAYVADGDYSTLQAAQNAATLRNLDQQRNAAKQDSEALARTERRSMRSCLPEFCRA
jgi:hypothetical protein